MGKQIKVKLNVPSEVIKFMKEYGDVINTPNGNTKFRFNKWIEQDENGCFVSREEVYSRPKKDKR